MNSTVLTARLNGNEFQTTKYLKNKFLNSFLVSDFLNIKMTIYT